LDAIFATHTARLGNFAQGIHSSILGVSPLKSIMAGSMIRGVLHSFVNRDFGELRRSIFQKTGPSPAPELAIHPFDIAHGTDTSGLIKGEDLSMGLRNGLWSTAYYGISPALLIHLINTLNIDYRDFTFLDLGSGKGRALLVASRFPFRRIVGIELSSQLSAVATNNIAKFSALQQCRDIEARTGDATTFDYPAGPLVLYLYNPFLVPTLKRCLRNLARSLADEPREVYLIYINPAPERFIRKHIPALRKQWEQTFAINEEDILVDRLNSTQERVAVYRYLPEA
jgi:SAM-dependent methyltransferase